MMRIETPGFRRVSILVAACLGAAVFGFAQEVGKVPPQTIPVQGPKAYGTSSLTCRTIQAFDFQPFSDGETLQADGAAGRYLVATPNFTVQAPLYLPSGAVIDHFELDGCDADATARIAAELYRCSGGICSSAPFGVAQTTDLATPGCTTLSSAVDALTVDNLANYYFVQVSLTVAGNTVSFRAVRVFYKLQVSAGPAVATFGDVPTTAPQFRFVEALAAAGITAGCGGGNFCPNDPITRGQMAVFLSAALGLHFPN